MWVAVSLLLSELCPEAKLVFHWNKALIPPSSTSNPLQGAGPEPVQSCHLKLQCGTSVTVVNKQTGLFTFSISH